MKFVRVFVVSFIHIVTCAENYQYKSGPIDKSAETFQRWHSEFNQWISEASKGIIIFT